MDAHTEITNFAAACWSTELIDYYPCADDDHTEIIRNLATYGPAINERD